MPGILGLVTDSATPVAEETVRFMLQAIRHEPFYRHGYFSEEKGMPVYVGWTCHPHSFVDCMPIRNEKCNITLFLAGEVFSDSERIANLRSRGHAFDAGNASYLVHLYEELGEAFFQELNGCFSGVLIDQRQKRTFIFNDRFGMHRVFFHQGKGGFFFSSEAKAILAVLPETREFDPKGLCELLTCGCTLGENSLFKGIQVLPGGSLLEFDGAKLVRRTQYFNHAAWEGQTRLSEAQFGSRFIGILPKVTQKYFFSETSVGMSLTGGLDSRMVMACLDPPHGTLPCYTFGSQFRDTFDVKVAREVAKTCGQTHQVLVLGKEFLGKLPDFLERAVVLSDGYLGLSGAAELYANSLARTIAPVRLTGNYGGEVLRGVRAFKWTRPRGDWIHGELSHFVEQSRSTFAQLNQLPETTFAAFQQAPYQGYGRLAIERSQLDLRTPFLDNELLALVYQSPDTSNGITLANNAISCYKPSLMAIATDRGHLGVGGSLAKKFRRLHREASFKCEYWVSHGAPDWLVRREHVLGWLRLEDRLLGWHKFYHLRRWLKDRFSDYVRETLLKDPKADVRPYLGRGFTDESLSRHFDGQKNYTHEIDAALTLALTCKFLFRNDGVHKA